MNESTLLSIKEFAEFTGASQSTLRYYDEIGILPAASRAKNNYRYYTPFQIIKLNYINTLVDLGVPLSVIKEMNKDRTPESVIGLLGRQEIILNRHLYELQTAYSIIHTYRRNIQSGIMSRDGMIGVEELEAENYIFGGENDLKFKTDETFYEEFVRFCKSADKYRINLRYPVGGYHEDMNAFLNIPNRPDRFFSLDPFGNYERRAGKYLVGYNRGYYGDFGDMPQKMSDYARKNNITFKGPVYIVYLLDEISITNPNQYLSRIIASISEKK